MQGALRRGVQYIFNKDTVAGGEAIDENMGYGPDELAVLEDGGAGHADVK